MKKTQLFSALALASLLAGMPNVPVAADNDTTADAYDFSGFTEQKILDLFVTAAENGRKYPTDAEWAAAGIQKADLAFFRSHVRCKKIIDRSDRLLQNTFETRDLWMNLPMSYGKGPAIGQPTKTFDSDVFSVWNYTRVFGSWNHGLFQTPSAWTDAAHRNGTDMYSGIKFFDTTGNPGGVSSAAWRALISTKNADGTYKYVDPIINCLMYFGFDGINFNWEDTGYNNADVIAFHKALQKKALENGFTNFHLGIYTSMQGLTTANVNGLFGNSEGRTCDFFGNYSGGDFAYSRMASNAQTALNAMGTTEGLYQGVWIVSMDRAWDKLDASENAKKVSLCLWGEHDQSRFWSYNYGDDSYDRQSNYQYLLERLVSGGNRNPLERPAASSTGNNIEPDGDKKPLSTFAGLATWIPERTTITGNLPFATGFNLGNGERYSYKGKKTAGAWYNMSTQDVVPTYRWLVVKPGTQTVSTDVDVKFAHEDQYTGGSCLQLSGKATAAGTDIVLYKTDLNVSAANPFVKIAMKNGKQGVNPSSLYVIVQKADGSWVETPVGDLNGATWQEKQIALNGVAQSDVIKHIGLRVKGSDEAYKLYVGKLELNDDIKAIPANVKDLVVEVKEETKSSLSAKLYWDVDATAGDRADWDFVYNDEANIDHFEILYKNGEQGRVSEIGRTSSWATYIGDILFENATDDPYIGVRSVSTDLKTYSPVEWVHVTRADQATLPARKDDSYGISQMDPECAGADIARAQRYVTDVTTTGADGNLDYHTDHPVLDGTQYDDQTALTLKVHQGQEVTLKLKCFDTSNESTTDGLRYCFAGGWIDLNGDHTFNPASITDDPANGERLFFLGTSRAATPAFETEGISCTFKVPDDAVTGKSRLRIVFSDAWFQGSFLPTGLHNKGFSMDFGVEITGTNPERKGPEDTHDQGVADEPEGLNGGNSISTAKAAISTAELADGAINFQNVDKAWVYDANGALVQYLVAPAAYSTNALAKGVYLVKMQSGNVIRSQKLAVK